MKSFAKWSVVSLALIMASSITIAAFAASENIADIKARYNAFMSQIRSMPKAEPHAVFPSAVTRVNCMPDQYAWSGVPSTVWGNSDGLGAATTYEWNFGDGRADLDFTVPTFGPAVAGSLQHKTLQIIFVGREQDLPPVKSPDEGLRGNIIIQATGTGDLAFNWIRDIIQLVPATGARVASAVLDFLQLWDCFRSF